VSVPYATPEQEKFALSLADCGGRAGDGAAYIPSSAAYNVVVRGDSSVSTVRVTVSYSSRSGGYANIPVERVACSSLGVWERTVSETVKTTAEEKYRLQRAAGR
jgi:hypothetical protein